MRKAKTKVFVCMSVVLLASVAFSGPTYELGNFTNNTPYGEQRTSIWVTVDEHNDGVFFQFGLDGDGSISEIYFEDGTLLDIANIINSPDDVVFTADSLNPSNLPGGNELDTPFVATQSLSLEAFGNNATGIGDGETLDVVYTLQGEKGYSDVLASLALGLNDPTMAGSLRIGVHVHSLGDNENFSDSFTVVPVPGSMILSGIGISLIGVFRKYRKKAQSA